MSSSRKKNKNDDGGPDFEEGDALDKEVSDVSELGEGDDEVLDDEEEEAKKTLAMELEDITAERLNRLPVEQIEIPKDPPVKDVRMIEFSNPLSRPIDEEVQKMTPLEMFMFVIDDYCKEIAQLSRDFAMYVYNDKNARITREDIELYIFLFIYLSVYQIPEIDMVWEDNKCFSNIMQKLITKTGYRKINQCLCIFKNNDETYKDKLKVNQDNKTDKIDGAIAYFNKKWQALFPPTKYLTIDEAMTAYQGGVSFKQYIKDKNKKMGIKFFAKASADKGYMYRLIPYSGKGFKYNETIGIGATIVKELADGHQNKGFHFTLDSYYSNLYSFKFLYDSGIGFTGTFVRDRKALPEKIRKTNVRPGGAVLYQLKNTSIKMYMFHAVKQVQLASSCYGAEKVKYINASNRLKYKPEMIAYYNLTKSGVDLSDCATQIYKSQRKTYTWWKAVFFYLIDVSMNNCKICYLSSMKFRDKIPRNGALFFRRVLINQFIEYFHPNLENEQRFIKVRFVLPDNLPLHFPVPITGPQERCYSCRYNSSFRCRVCNVPLCQSCFPNFHFTGQHETLLGRPNRRNMRRSINRMNDMNMGMDGGMNMGTDNNMNMGMNMGLMMGMNEDGNQNMNNMTPNPNNENIKRGTMTPMQIRPPSTKKEIKNESTMFIERARSRTRSRGHSRARSRAHSRSHHN